MIQAAISFVATSLSNGYGNATIELLCSTIGLLWLLLPLANFNATNCLTPAVVVNRGSYEGSQPDVCGRRVCCSAVDFSA